MPITNCLYINFATKDKFGGGIYNETILRILQETLPSVDLFTFPLEMSRLQNLRNTMLGYLNGMSRQNAKDIIKTVKNKHYDLVFLASSNWGNLAKQIKKQVPETKVCVLFNNIEFNFISSQLLTKFKPQLLLTLLATYINERNCTWYADKTIVLNKREANELIRIYKKAPDAIIPIVLKDNESIKEHIEKAGNDSNIPSANTANDTVKDKKKHIKGLFVGSNFYANLHAVEWFSKFVAPFLKDTTIEIVGKGFENERHLETDSMRIIGSVESTEKYYLDADFVLEPIFKGAGMKVKVAEAMMYGRTIIGTPEAFEGYSDINEYGVMCKTADDFISVINSRSFVCGFNTSARSYFLAHYEYQQVKNKLFNILNS